MDIVVTWYEESFKNKVIALFEKEYHVSKNEFETLFNQFYFHPFQKDKCILIMALDGDVLAGFQSFFYWPYLLNDKIYNSYQSGNSLVNPDYRGKGIFQKMLAFIDRENKTKDIEFLMGFPVEASYKNFMKDKWLNVFNLNWHLKINNPFGFFNRSLARVSDFKSGCHYFHNSNSEKDKLRISMSADFIDWRKTYMKDELYYSFTFNSENGRIIFHLKKNKRAKIFNELIIGNVLFENEGAIKDLALALKKLNRKIVMSFNIHFISIAFNSELNNEITQEILNAGFKKSKKAIYFIAKNYKSDVPVYDASKWIVYRSDIDTW